MRETSISSLEGDPERRRAETSGAERRTCVPTPELGNGTRSLSPTQSCDKGDIMRITKTALLILSLVILALLTVRDAETKLVVGTLSHDVFPPYLLGIDFSEARIDVPAEASDWKWIFGPDIGNYDVAWGCVPEGGVLFFGQLIWLRETKYLSEVKTAPEEGYEKGCAEAREWYLGSFQGELTYVCITQEGHYVKLRCTYDSSDRVMTIHYVYQTDGSRNLDESTFVKPSTWGGIKSFLKKERE